MRVGAAIAAALAVLVLVARPAASDRLGPEVLGSPSTRRRAARPLVLVTGALGLLLVVAMTPLVLPALGAAALVAVLWRRQQRARLEQACRRGVPDVLFAFAAELRVGRPVADALAAVAVCGGPLERPLTEVALAVGRGADVADELAALSGRRGHERLAAVAAAWRATSPLGASLSGVLERLGEAYEQDDVADDELRAALAGPRSSVLMLTCLPVMGLVLGESVGAHPTHLLLHRPLGWALLSGAVLLDAAGVAWSRRIVGSALSER